MYCFVSPMHPVSLKRLDKLHGMQNLRWIRMSQCLDQDHDSC